MKVQGSHSCLVREHAVIKKYRAESNCPFPRQYIDITAT